jgi:branched-chain amino acid transport system substrate-binding protein
VLYTYAAVQVFAQAAEAAGSTELEALLPVMNGQTFNTVLGELSFNDEGDVTLPGYVFYEWRDGNYDYLEN